MTTTSVLIGSDQNIATQTPDVWTIPTTNLVFLSDPGIAASYPGSGTSVTNVAPGSAGEVGTIGGNTTHDGNHFVFDGVSGGITWSDTAALQDFFSGGATILAWINFDSDGEGNAGRVITKDGGGVNGGWGMYATGATDPTVIFFMRATTIYQYDINGSLDVVNYSGWHLVAFEVDSDSPGTTPSGWVDGSPTTVTVFGAGSGSYISDDGTDLVIGNNNVDNTTADGKIGLVAVYSGGLTNAQHLAFYNATKGAHGGTIDNEATCAFSLGGAYLYHPTTNLSIMGTLESALAAAGVDGADVFLGQDGYVHISATGPIGITWGSDTTLRDYLGFTGDLSPATSHTAQNLSPLSWIPWQPESPEKGILLGLGALDHRDITHKAVDGTMNYRSFGDPLRMERWKWRYIAPEFYWTTSEANGELFQFVRDVLGKRHSFYIYQRNSLDGSLSTEAALTNASGPWKADGKNAANLIKQIAQGFANRECRFDFVLNAVESPEYT